MWDGNEPQEGLQQNFALLRLSEDYAGEIRVLRPCVRRANLLTKELCPLIFVGASITAQLSNFTKVWLLLAFMALLVGCQPVDSFNPLYRDRDVIFDSALLGKWTENGGTLEFLQAGEKTYDVIFTDDSTPPERMVLEGRLVNLEGRRFLDLIQKEWTAKPASYQLSLDQGKKTPSLLAVGDGAYIELFPGKAGQTKLQLRVAHWFFRLANDANTLRLDYIDDERLAKALEQKAVQIDHILVGPERKPGETDDRRLALTAATADLQKFVLEHVNDDQMFADSIKFKRGENATADPAGRN
jgi:hypothetical protein